MIFQAILMSLLYVFNVFAIKEFYDLKATDIYGMDVDFQKFKGKVLLRAKAFTSLRPYHSQIDTTILLVVRPLSKRH